MSNQNGYSRERAWSLLNEYTQSVSLLKHALAVETCVRAYGEREADAQGLTGEPREHFVEQYVRLRYTYHYVWKPKVPQLGHAVC